VRLYVDVGHPGVLAALRELELAARGDGHGVEGHRADDIGAVLRAHPLEYRLGWEVSGREVAWLRPGRRARIPLLGLGRAPHPIVVGGVVDPATPKGDYRIQLMQRDMAGHITGGAAIDLRVGVKAGPKGRARRISDVHAVAAG
jgi:hypothetical protein